MVLVKQVGELIRCWRSWGAAEVSGVPGLLSGVVRSMIGLLGDVVLVSIVLMLSMVVSGLSFVSVAVGANVGVTGTGTSWSWGAGGCRVPRGG